MQKKQVRPIAFLMALVFSTVFLLSPFHVQAASKSATVSTQKALDNTDYLL